MLDNIWVPFRSDEGGHESENEAEEEPTQLNTLNYGNFLVVSNDKLRVRYTGIGQHNHDVGAIQSDLPAPSNRSVYYYEVEVKDAGNHGKIAVGFADKTFKLSRQPGWELHSYGYHGDDGQKFSGSGTGHPYATPYGAGDVVGAGIILSTQDIFFTKNGKLLDIAYHQVKLPLYPTIGLHSTNECVEVNFGQKKFMYDIDGLIQREHINQQSRYNDIDLPHGDVHAVVRQYLQHYGYKGTLGALDQACGDGPGGDGDEGGDKNDGGDDDDDDDDDSEDEDENEIKDGEGRQYGTGQSSSSGSAVQKALEDRARIRQLVLEGQVDAAFTSLKERFPKVLEKYPSVTFHLHRQKFIELVKEGAEMEGVQYARQYLAPYRGTSALYDNALCEVLAVMEYEDPGESPELEHLMGFHQREAVADVINAGVLISYLGLQPGYSGGAQSSLEMLLCQVAVGHTELREANGGLGELFKLHKVTAV